MMENENHGSTNIMIFFIEIMVVEYGICDHDLRKKVEILVKTLVFVVAWNYNGSMVLAFDMMKPQAIIQVKASENMAGKSNSARWSRTG